MTKFLKKNTNGHNLWKTLAFHGSWFLHWIVLGALLRLLFHVGNAGIFEGENFSGKVHAYLFGAWVDSIVAFYIFIPVLVLALLFYWLTPKFSKLWVRWTFRVLGLLVIVFTMISSTYFPIGKQHIGLSLFQFLEEGNNVDLWVYLSDYFLYYVTTLILIIAWWVASRNISMRFSGRFIWLHILCMGMVFFIARGGTRLRPLRNADAANYVESEYVPLAQNALLVLADDYLYGENPPSFVANFEQCSEVFDAEKTHIQGKNLVIIILESFGLEYTSQNGSNLPSYTPFLDSLSQYSTSFSQFYAAGLKSMDAVPAIYSGIPKLSKQSFIALPTAAKIQNSFLTDLSEDGYIHVFFHGAHPQSMGFQSYLKSVGLDHYYSRDDYPNSQHSGEWGIYDHHFLKYALEELGTLKEPFSAGIFTLSSHHPYEIPIEFNDEFPKGNLPIHESIGYTDYAVQQFMHAAKEQDWYDSTLFVFLADHTSENQLPKYKTNSGKYRIPCIIFDPQNPLPTLSDRPYGQADLAKLLTDYGRKDSLKGAVQIQFDNGQYRLVTDSFKFGLDETGRPLYLYRTKDKLDQENLVQDLPEAVLSLRSAAFQKIGCAWKRFYE
jgi:phosphoglycerol transferase MdoB-like AlkP superfamily enzyme